MSRRPWMPLYIGDYLADTQHLTTVQHGAYILLIMSYWQRGGLPTDEEAIAGICRLNRTQWESNRQAIAKLFLPGWKHKRVEAELEKVRSVSEKRAMSGRKGGLAGRGKTNEERFVAQAIAKQTGTHSHSHRESLTSNSEPRDGGPPKGASEGSKGLLPTASLSQSIRDRGWLV